MGKKRGRSKTPPIARIADSVPPDPGDITKLNSIASNVLASMIRDDAAADAAKRVDHVNHDDGSARTSIVVGPDGIPRFTDDDDGPRETTRVDAPSAALRAQAKRASSHPPARLVRGADGVARFVDEDADGATASETTRANVVSAELVERTKQRE